MARKAGRQAARKEVEERRPTPLPTAGLAAVNQADCVLPLSLRKRTNEQESKRSNIVPAAETAKKTFHA
jgi:hypothetical protein